MNRNPSSRSPFGFPSSKRKNKTTAPKKRLSIRDIAKNYRLYRAEMRQYKAQKKLRKALLKKQRREEQKNNLDNPFFQLLFSKERSKKVLMNEEGTVLYVPSRLNAFIHIVNSTLSFLLAYLFVYMFYQMVVLLTASFQEIYGVLYYYKLSFNDHSSNWTVLNIIGVTLSGPLASIILGLFFYNYLFFKARSFYSLRLFYYWVGILGFAHFFAAFISGVITNKGFGYVPLWLFWNDFTKFFFALIALVSLVLIGYFSASRLQATSNNIFRIQKENRALFFLQQSLLPYLLGMGIIFLIKTPNNPAYETLTLVFGSIFSLAVFFNLSAPNFPFAKENKRAFFNISLLLLVLVLYYSWRVFLADGLYFVIQFLIKVTPL